MSNRCSMCGIAIPEGQRVCSMCYGDPYYGKDGYYLQWMEEQEREEEERQQEMEEQMPEQETPND